MNPSKISHVGVRSMYPHMKSSPARVFRQRDAVEIKIGTERLVICLAIVVGWRSDRLLRLLLPKDSGVQSSTR